MNPKSLLKEICIKAIKRIFGLEIDTIEIQKTKDEFEGDYTLVVFPLVKYLQQKPEQIANTIGNSLLEEKEIIHSYNVVKGFLNITLQDKLFINFLNNNFSNPEFGIKKEIGNKIMVEYSSPNTNKPIHLGHIRNNLLGYSISKILKAAGNEVITSQIINDRGIHICKSMLAWQKYGEGETPESSKLKGDHLVGKYYVIFDKEYQKQVNDFVTKGHDIEEAKKKAPILLEAQEMLRKWEEGDTEIRELWHAMNHWVYQGFEMTYKQLGVSFDIIQYESNTYLLGKDIVEKGLEKGILLQKEDGSIWADLTEEGLDQKLLLRADGTSVYMTQDLGTAVERFAKYKLDQLIYTVGNEQDYHFQVLFLVLKKLGYTWADQMYHLSYGMVDLPSGKMKSREGTVVDADELMHEMIETAKQISIERGKLEEFTQEDKSKINESVGLGALKYYILKVDPKKRILFNPEESVEFNGNTGPFIQYTYARIQSILRKEKPQETVKNDNKLNEVEKNLIIQLSNFPEAIEKSAHDLNPSIIANYVYEVVKEFNHLYQNYPILNSESIENKHLRLELTQFTGQVIALSLHLLGIESPDRM
ncbi:arginine--tRNA ligase [Apibacter muscae]|uniref:Arginine--tRNA ligase n=1 Tax=Apibacter muscae TaxID=2509004 RepID=A0A563DFQ3_9FLAO|nr:arginine--tRNA ligase [Apibacter muscae]TWP28811.1 arginine--tRNA ligase [Apibacter muscae]